MTETGYLDRFGTLLRIYNIQRQIFAPTSHSPYPLNNTSVDFPHLPIVLPHLLPSSRIQTTVKMAEIERAYRKQHLFQNAKSKGGKKIATKTKRWYKDVGLGFKTPSGE